MSQQLDTQMSPTATLTRDEARLVAIFADAERDPILALILAAAREVLTERQGTAAC